MKNRTKIRKGDIICYRMGLVKVLKVLEEGLEVRGAYGVEQTIDWEDVETYNRGQYLTPYSTNRED